MKDLDVNQILIIVILSTIIFFILGAISSLIINFLKGCYTAFTLEFLFFFKNKKIKFESKNRYLLCFSKQYMHVKGMQIIDKISIDNIIGTFKTYNKFLKPFSSYYTSGVPIYIGHLDEHSTNANYLRGQIIGYAVDIRVDYIDDIPALTYTIKFTNNCKNELIKLIEDGVFAVSPRWQMQYIEDINFRPIKLISLALTQNPNIEESGSIIKQK
jgi:hypothetical protein